MVEDQEKEEEEQGKRKNLEPIYRLLLGRIVRSMNIHYTMFDIERLINIMLTTRSGRNRPGAMKKILGLIRRWRAVVNAYENGLNLPDLAWQDMPEEIAKLQSMIIQLFFEVADKRIPKHVWGKLGMVEEETGEKIPEPVPVMLYPKEGEG